MATLPKDLAEPRPIALELVSDPRGTNASLVEGLATLQNLLGMIRLPQSQAQEHAALAVLLKLAADEEWPQVLEPSKTALLSHLELLTVSDVKDHLAWFEDGPENRGSGVRGRGPRLSSFGRLLRFRPQAVLRARARLLFVLLAMIAARVYRFSVLRALTEEHIVGGHEQLDSLLSWLRLRRTRPNELALVQGYLALVRDELFAQADHMQILADDLAETEFAAGPWTRQLVGLEYRRSRWDRLRPAAGKAPPNPVYSAGQLEFRLTRARAFAPLARKGGIVASASLERMGYRDASPPPVRASARVLWIAGALLVCAAIAGALAIHRLRVWDRQSLALAAEVIRRIESGDLQPLNVGGE